MTTDVTVNAHCAENKEVKIVIDEDDGIVEEFTIQNGEIAQRSVYDGLNIHVREILKK